MEKTIESKELFHGSRGLIIGDLIYITCKENRAGLSDGWYMILPHLSLILLHSRTSVVMNKATYLESLKCGYIEVTSVIKTLENARNLEFCALLNSFISQCYSSSGWTPSCSGIESIREYIVRVNYPAKFVKVAQGVFFGKDAQYTWIVPEGLEVKKGDIVKVQTRFGEQVVKIKKVEVLSETNFDNRLGGLDIQEIIEVLDI